MFRIYVVLLALSVGACSAQQFAHPAAVPTSSERVALTYPRDVLYVLDGRILPRGDTASVPSAVRELDPAKIDRIEVLKGAAAKLQTNDALRHDAAAGGEWSRKLGFRQFRSAVVEHDDALEKIAGRRAKGVSGPFVAAHSRTGIVDEQKLTGGVVGGDTIGDAVENAGEQFRRRPGTGVTRLRERDVAPSRVRRQCTIRLALHLHRRRAFRQNWTRRLVEPGPSVKRPASRSS